MMWAGQVSSPARLERKEKRMHVRRGKEGQNFPCNLRYQWRFSGNTGCSSTTNNPFCGRFSFRRVIFISMGSICSVQVSQWCLDWRPHLCGKPLYITGNTPGGGGPEGGRKGRGEDPLSGTFKTVQKKLTGT